MFPTPLFRFYILVRTQDEICSLKFLSIADYRHYIVQHRSILSTSISPSQFYNIKYSFIKRNSHFLDIKCSSVQSLSHVNSLRTHELQHARPPCPSPTPRVHSNSRPSSQWCHPAISSSVVPFSSCPQSLPASESFPMNQHFAWCGQSTGVSTLASFLPKKSQGWSP